MTGIGMTGYAQRDGYWQQEVAYDITARLDVKTHQLKGRQSLVYRNHSPDTLRQLYYHLYFNAFRPNSMMDVRSRVIRDPDRRVRDRIYHLDQGAQGFQKVVSLTQDGVRLRPEVEGTLLSVPLVRPLLPGASTKLDMRFEAQVPTQVRRTGRDNAEGIAYSMAQWYPKLAEYDTEGWHTDAYVGREFYGVWGDFEVRLILDTAYVVAATGIPQSDKALPADLKIAKSERLWHFKAEDVHDFVWAADPDYLHDQVTATSNENKVDLHFYYQADVSDNWQALQSYMVRALAYISAHFGPYPYDRYAFIQGGDGGMEYPMATLITGKRPLQSLVGVSVHELLHSWYQGLMASHEGRYAWLDEGFTSYAEEKTMRHLFPEKKEEGPLLVNEYASYKRLVASGLEEPMNTWSDHFQTNYAYSQAAYVKGAIFQHQLSYIVGEETLGRALRRYAERWRFKHPTPTDYLRVVEKEAQMNLDWYYAYFAQSTHSIDYGLRSVEAVDQTNTRIVLARIGAMPMPIELVITQQDGTQTLYYIPLRMMRGVKREKEQAIPRHTLSDWPWTHPLYAFEIPLPIHDIKHIQIDPSDRMADLNPANQRYPVREKVLFEGVLNTKD